MVPAKVDAADHHEPKLCPTCGRWFDYRAKWARNWSEVRFCSAKCRGGPSSAERAIETLILAMIAARPNGSLCPSEVARRLAADAGSPEAWRPEMNRVHDATRRLAGRGEIVVMQRGRVVDAATARGPTRLRRG